MGSTNTGAVMTIANSIIGVSVLAMPFCFKECGIVLSILMLILSSILSRLTCYLLLKSAVMARRRNFEFLAFHIFGPTGKFVAELCIIGFLMGTCIAFFVVVGDLGPAIISKTLDIDDFSAALRPSVLIGLAVIVVLPLGLLRNVDSLSSICTATIGFYVCLVLKVVVEALPHLMSGIWLEKVNLWRPAGVLQCLPIFSMALFCQTQLFEIYESIPNPSFERMNGAVRSAINLCAGVYISVGFFGYVAFCTQTFGGNILMSFSPTMMSEVIKLGFVMSVAVSFPLVIFPCRASLYSLLFRGIQFPPHEGGNTFIPEARFKCITVFIIAFSLVIGLLIPNIELVLGLVGSTIGVGICVMFPALAFIFVSTKDTADRVIAQFLLFVGILILVLGTYATIYAANETPADRIAIPDLPKIDPALDKVEIKLPQIVEKTEVKEIDIGVVKEADVEARKEPPVPVDPIVDQVQIKPIEEDKKTDEDKPKVPDIKVENVLEETNVSKEKVKGEAVIDKDALKKEDEELALANIDTDQVKKENDLLKTLEKHKEEQNKLLEEQREIIQKLKEEKIENKKEKDDNPSAVVVDSKDNAPVKNVAASNDGKLQQQINEQHVKVEEEKEILKILVDKAADNALKDKAADSALRDRTVLSQDAAGKLKNDILEEKILPVVVIPKIPETVNAPIKDPIKQYSSKQPIAYQQRFLNKENNVKPEVINNVIPEIKPGVPFIPIKTLVGPPPKIRQQNVLDVKDNVYEIPNNLPNIKADEIAYLDGVKKNSVNALDDAKSMRRDILETDEETHEREKREALMMNNTVGVVPDDGVVPDVGVVVPAVGERPDADNVSEVKEGENCRAQDKTNSTKDVISSDVQLPTSSVVELAKDNSGDSLIKISSHLTDPILDVNVKDLDRRLDLDISNEISALKPMPRDLKSLEKDRKIEVVDKDAVIMNDTDAVK